MAANAWESFGLSDPESFRAAPIDPPSGPLKDDRNIFARINDWMIDTGNAAASLAKAGVGFVSPGGGAAQSIADFIQSGQDNQSDYRKKLREQLGQIVEEAKANGYTGAMAWLEHNLRNPITELLPEAVGNFVPFAAAGRVAGALGAARAGAAGLGAAETAAAGTKAALGATSTLGGVVGAGGVRSGYYDDILKTPDEQLLKENPRYAEMRQTMYEQDAKKAIGAEMNPRLAAGMAAGGTVGILSGRLGAEQALFGKNPGFAKTFGAEVGGEFVEGSTQQAAQNYAVQGQLPSKTLMDDVILQGVQEAATAAPGGAVAGLVHRQQPPKKTDAEIIKDIVGAPDLESAVAETQKVFDQNTIPPAILTAADNTGMVNRMSDDALLSAQARFEEESAQAQRVMREQAFGQAEQPPANVGGILDQRQADLANQEQGAREQGLDQMRADQARAAVNTPIAEGQTSDLGSGRTDAGIQGPMQAAFARLQEQRNAQTGSARDAVGSAVQPAVLESAVGVPGGQNLVEPARRDAGAGGVQPVSGRTVDGSPASVAAGPRGVLPSDGPSAIDRLNQSLAAERKQRGVDTGQPSVTMVEPDSLPVTRQRAKNGGETLSKHEFETVKKFAELFGKKVELFRHNRPADNAMNADSFDGAVIDSDTQTIFLNADAKDAHHLVVAGHEIGHQMKKDAPDLYKTLESRLKSDLKDGNLANFARYYGTAEKDVYAKLRNADSRGALVEEFISDLIGNRSAEYKTMLDIFGAAKGSKDAGMIYKVAQFLVDFIDGLLAKINRTKFATDAMVGDLKKVRTEVRAALKEYAVRQNRESMQERVKAFEQSRQAERAAAEKATPLAKEVDGAVDRVAGPVVAKKVEWKTPPEAFSRDKKPLTPPVKRSAERAYSIKTNKDGTILVSGDITQIRDAIPDSIRGRKMGDALAFTVGDAHRVKAALEGRENTYSRGGEIVKQWPVKDGKYVGAAPGFDTPGTITKWRKALRALADEGAPGRFWYENSSKAILQMAGGDVAEARKFVATLAIYSPQAKVDANSTFALRAWAQYKAGVPIKVKTGVQDRQATEILYDNKQWGGEKTGNFFTNLLREIDPSTAGKQGATIDMWMMRAGQYPTDAPTKNQYGFMENETNKLAQSLGWEPQQVQAAIWVAMKARMENSGVKKRTEASSEKRGWLRYDYPEKDGKPKKTRVIIDAQKHRDNWLKESFAHDVSKEDTLAAKFDFSDGVRRHIGQVSWEARPGRSTGVLPGVNDAPYDQQLEFQQAVSSAFYGPEGQDLLAQHLGLLADGSVFAPGVWQKEVAAGQQNAIARAPAAGDDGKKSVDPAQSKLMDIYASVIGWLTHQEGVGWHRPFYSASKRDSNGLDINVGRPLTAKEMLAVEGAIGEKMAELKVDDWQNGLGLISSPTGVRVVNFGAVENSVLQSDVMSAAADVLPDHEWRTFASSGNLVVNDWKENPDGQGYVQRASAEGRPDVFRWAADILAPRVQAVYTEYSKKYDWGDPGQIRLPATAEVKRSASRQTDTKAFKKWFDGSKAVDKKGDPTVVYHGTPDADIVQFKGDSFFTDKADMADGYTMARGVWRSTGKSPAIYPAYLSLQNPLVIDALGKRSNNIPVPWKGWSPTTFGKLPKGAVSVEAALKYAKDKGHDGLIVRNVLDTADPTDRQKSTVYAVTDSSQVKSATGNDGTFSPTNPDIRKSSQRAPVFYSALAKAVSSINAKSQPAFGWKQQIEALIRKGDVKADEVQWTGLNEFLDLQQGKVSKESVEQFLSANGVRLEETMLGDRSLPKGWKVEKNDDGFVVLDQDGDEMGSGDTREEAISSAQDEDADDTKYGTYVVPGGKNYKELLLRLPVTKPTAASMKEAGWSARDNGEYWTIIDENGDGRGSAKNVDTEDAALEKWASFAATNAPGATKEYQSSHWDEPNIVAHTRIDERTDVDGDRVLFVHELQSDWGQQGKKEGFNKTNILPAAPFVTKTDSWVGLTLKRLIMHAVENNFDKVAIINGEQAADLYDLSRQVDAIRVARTSGNHFNIVAEKNGREVIDQGASSDQLENMIGKDLAQKSMSIAVGKDESYSGLDLKVGGEGMKTFYDSIVPKVAKNIAKKLGGTTSEVRVGMSWNEYLQSRGVREENGKLFARGDFELSGGALRDQYKQAHPNGQTAQFGITITPEMRETVLQKGLPLFSKTRSPYLGALDPAQQAAAKAVGAITQPLTKKEQFDKLKANLGLRVRQGLVDQFAAIKEIDPAAYRLARMSKNEAGPLEATMLYGKPTIRDGVYDVKIDPKGGFAKVLADLDGEHDRFLLWVAAKRADRLKAEGRENLFTDTDISALKTLNKGRETKFDKALMALNEYNESTLKIALDSGLIDQDAYDIMKGQAYVPFYRVMEDGIGASGPRFSSGLKGQTAFKKLKGGTNQLSQDLLSNVMQNWSHLYAASARNRAMNAAVTAAEKIGIAFPVPAGTKNAVKFMRNGETQHYEIVDDYLFEAVSAVEAQTPSWMKGFSAFKRALTIGVTVSPSFRVRNLIRDSLAVIGQSDIGINPASNIKTGWKALGKDSQTRASLIAGGGVIRFGAMLEGSNQTNRLIEKEMKKGTILNQSNWKKLTGQMGKVWDAYQELGDKAEGANRAALYEQLIAKGETHADAIFMARDLMDFSMGGRWPVVRFLAQSVPFLNARLVGLDKLARSAKDNPKRLYYTAAAISIASIALAAAQGDDEDFKKLEDWRRDAYWNFRIGSTMFSIPKPFELGAIGTLAERTFELAFDKEMTGKRYRERLSAMMTQTFAMSPIPQILRPLIDVWSNKDSFTGRAIETMGMERLRPQDRYSERTSSAAKFLGQIGMPNPASLMMGQYSSLSPVQIDSLVRGYFGWLGVTATSALEFGLRPMTDAGTKPSMQLRDVFLAGSFVESLPSGSSRYVTQFYDQAKEIEQAYASYRDALKRGDMTKARDIMESDREKIVKHSIASSISKSFANYNSQTKQIMASKLMSPDEKRRMLDYISAQKNRLAESVNLN